MVTISIILNRSQLDAGSLIQAERNEKALRGIQKTMMRARSTLDWSRSNISSSFLYFVHCFIAYYCCVSIKRSTTHSMLRCVILAYTVYFTQHRTRVNVRHISPVYTAELNELTRSDHKSRTSAVNVADTWRIQLLGAY